MIFRLNSNIKNIIKTYLLPDINDIKIIKSKCLIQLKLETENIYIYLNYSDPRTFKKIVHYKHLGGIFGRSEKSKCFLFWFLSH